MEIELTIQCYNTRHFMRGKFRRLASDVFGIPVGRIDTNIPIRIKCTPEQFTKYVIWRDDRGFKNGIKDLSARIVRSTTTWQVNIGEAPIKKWNAIEQCEPPAC